MLRRHAAHPTLGFVLSGCLLWIGGCAGDRSSGGPLAPRDALSPAAVTATRYALRRVDGFTLPRRLCSNAPETITGGAVALRSDGIFNARISYRTTGATISQVQAKRNAGEAGGRLLLLRPSEPAQVHLPAAVVVRGRAPPPPSAAA